MISDRLPGPLRIPSADETKASVARFRESAERYFLVDFVRDRLLNRTAPDR